MPKYRLFYFNSKGFAEMARLVFALAEVEYEDVRIEREKWPEFKSKTPFQQMPVLEVDGVQIADSSTIARYLAKQFGMAGKGPIEEAQVDMYAAAACDLVKPLPAMMNVTDEKRKELVEKFLQDTLPKFMDRFESTLAASKSGYLVGDGVTWADLVLFTFMGFLPDMMPPEVYAKYPNVQKLVEKIKCMPKIAEWLKKRPVTQY